MAEIEQETAERDRDDEARRSYVLANVRQYPDPVLRMRAREVGEYDAALATLIERLLLVMTSGSGVGLAAPQVGVLQRVIVHQAREDEEPLALVNPRIVTSSDERDVMEEGCLSLNASSLVVEVERPVAITVEACTPQGEPLRFEADGLEARVIQHEVDHLDGVLTIDRTTPEQRRDALGKLRRQPVLGPIAG